MARTVARTAAKTFERKPTAMPCQPSPLVSSFPALETHVETSLIPHRLHHYHHLHLRAPSGLLVHLDLLAPPGLCPVFVGFLLVRAALHAEQSPWPLLSRSNPPLPPPPPLHVNGVSPSSLPAAMHTKAAVAMRACSLCLASGVPDALSSGAKNDLPSGGKVKVRVKAKANVNETPLPPPARHCSLRMGRVSHSPIHY